MIDVINLEKSFGDNKVLNGINITIDKGDIMVVIGPSGSGKSTFLRCLNCMEDPTGGQIIFNGVDIADPKVDINIHRRHMGMVFQHFNLYNNKTVIQNIMLAPVYVRCQDLKKAKRHNLLLPVTNLFRKEKQTKQEITTTKSEIIAEAHAKAEELLKRIGLEDKADVYPSTLSGGQKQRVAIVRALAMNPDVILFDEPTSALDFQNQLEVWKTLRSLAERGFTVVVCCHDPNHILWFCDQAVLLKNGRTLDSGAPENVMTGAALTELYGGACSRGELAGGLPVVHPAF